ncbi:hypothetical protein DM01DRAFT_1080464 [Hesseltinella vesiculosa]|uniref:Uncharacterized protein n=1 Tax=Hesseltinella vesiculosa TaxID=101127 RepID=A0A1X2GEW0_9FUNG|nr:hypothetical protein DM01DRAFT_1080464 [Hesseltinella vesiculosa]
MEKISIHSHIPEFARRVSIESTNNEFVTCQTPVKADLVKDLFGIQHIQFMHSSTFGNAQQATKDGHPNWVHLIMDWTHPPPSKQLTANIRSVYLNNIDTTLRKICKGESYVKRVRYVVRLLLRLWLVPIREQKYQAIKKAILQKQAKKMQKVSTKKKPILTSGPIHQ